MRRIAVHGVRTAATAVALAVAAAGAAAAAEAHPLLVGAAADPAATYRLTVVVTPAGAGRVTASSGMSGQCTSTCTADYPAGARPFLIAAPASADYAFSGWSGGGCSGTNLCNLEMNSDVTVTATFVSTTTYTVSVLRRGGGSGTVTSTPSGIDCGAVCSAEFAHGSSVTFAAAADSGSVFAGWAGDCAGTTTGTEPCVLLLDGPKLVEPIFREPDATVSLISTSCSGDVLSTTVTAQGDAGSTFTIALQTSNDGLTWADTGQTATITLGEGSSYTHQFDLTSLDAAWYRVVSGDVQSNPVQVGECGPGTPVPEAPVALLLPLSILATFGLAGALVAARRRGAGTTRRVPS
jgi:hypothetical protein